MGTQHTHGFTIIETMLVLAITGLLVGGIFVGVGTQIGVQRYRDAVETFKTVVQNQFNDLASIQNDRTDTWECSDQGVTSQTGSTVRGQSDCVLVGKILTVEGGAIQTAAIVARQSAVFDPDLNDVESLRENYFLNVSSDTVSNSVLEWGTQIAWPVSGDGSESPTTPRSFTLLVLRSPDSGQVYSFSANTVPTSLTPESLRSLVVAGAGTSGGQQEQILCIDSNDISVVSDYSIIIAPLATVPNAVEVSTNALKELEERNTRC